MYKVWIEARGPVKSMVKSRLRIGALVLASLAVWRTTASTHPPPQSASSPAAASSSSETVLALDASQCKVHWTVDSTLHMVHGTFAVKSGTLHFDPATGKAGGEIVVSTASGESGNGGRDSRMHKEILETAKYPEAVLHPQQIEGQVNASGVSEVKLRGMLRIHGADHPVTAMIHSEFAGKHWTGTAKFDVPYVTWGIKDPSNFLLKVKPVVNVELELSGDTR